MGDKDQACVHFLQWALPHLQLQWSGYRKVRGTVCKRLFRRLDQLGLADLEQYRAYLGSEPDEWALIDTFCRISISRFYRDRRVFDYIFEAGMTPSLERAATSRGRLRAWSAGCASGEEPYTLVLLWAFRARMQGPGTRLDVVATDVSKELLERARRGCYPASSLKELPGAWLEAAFAIKQGEFCLKPHFKTPVRFQQHDLRYDAVQGPFDLILCRNIAFTYFSDAMQKQIAQRLFLQLNPSGLLVLGAHEELPGRIEGLETICRGLPIYRRLPDQ